MPHYVLHDFAKADAEWLVPLLDAIADNAPLLAEGKDSTFANRLHAGSLRTPRTKKPKGKPAEAGEGGGSRERPAKPAGGLPRAGDG